MFLSPPPNLPACAVLCLTASGLAQAGDSTQTGPIEPARAPCLRRSAAGRSPHADRGEELTV
ncbi:MAG: hypothetical protein ACUBOA_01365 [Candidatus Loosdrechtia sp.]|uniref:hypothetical protein n=1 Tax=Candidatus Loosdrechtia sp. TaxID=3101272 RepID=UPI003A77A6A4|nr:MAG: hypothetical protein QY305_13215 [Candidatus Jettenia sp. AMX2]